MPLSNTVITPSFVFLPSYKYKLNWKVLITKENGTEYDVTNYINDVKIILPVTDSLGSCTITLDNKEGRYLYEFNGGEKIEIWGEYNSVSGTPTNKIYRGKLDSIFFSLNSSTGYVATVESRQVPEAIDKLVVEQYDNALIGDVIQDLIDKYLDGIVTYNNLSATSVRATVNFRHISVWKAISQLLDRAEQDGYVDTDMDLHTFDRSSVETTEDTVTLGQNVINVSRYGKDNLFIKNRILTYGKEDGNLIILKTEEDTSSQADLWLKDLVVNDSALTTIEEVQDRANVELYKNTTMISSGGQFSILGSPKLHPGETIKTEIPYCGITGQHRIAKVSHSLSTSGFITELDLSVMNDSIAEIFKERVDAEERLRPFVNLNYMLNSFYIDFEETDTPWSLSNCTITDGVLSISSGQSQGTITFSAFTADANINQCELRINVNYPNTDLDTYEISNDGGLTYEYITPGTVHTFSSTGKRLALKINLVSDVSHSPSYEGVAVLFK